MVVSSLQQFAQEEWGDGQVAKPECYVNTDLYDIEKVKATGRIYYIAGTDWKTKLQEMVVSKDPVKYLGNSL